MPLVPLITVIAGAATMLLLLAFAFAGPSVGKAQTRRLNSLRERHSGAASDAVMAAQMRRITGKRDSNKDRGNSAANRSAHDILPHRARP